MGEKPIRAWLSGVASQVVTVVLATTLIAWASGAMRMWDGIKTLPVRLGSIEEKLDALERKVPTEREQRIKLLEAELREQIRSIAREEIRLAIEGR